MRGLFVTATDTGVGKTVVTAALALALRDLGIDVGVAKPVQSGNLAADPDGDAGVLGAAIGAAPEPLVAYALAAPLAPLVAARLEGVSIDPARLVEHVHGLGSGRELLLVEGAGGLLVPLAEAFTIADLAVSLGLPLLVVARSGLGTVNHTALTVEAAKLRGLEVVGIVLNGVREETDRSVETNTDLIESLTGVPVLGCARWRSDIALRDGLRAYAADLDLAPLLTALDLEDVHGHDGPVARR